MSTKKTKRCKCGVLICDSSTQCRSCANRGENNPQFKSGKYILSTKPVTVDVVEEKVEEKVVDKGPHVKPFDVETEQLRGYIKELKKENTYLRKQKVTNDEVKKHILKITDNEPIIPDWTTSSIKEHGKGVTGVPTLQLSDWHLGETVFPEQVFHKNEYNVDIGMQRIERLCDNLIDVLDNHLYCETGYPGVVLLMNGDFFSGDIHDELTATNDKPIMPVFLDAFGAAIKFIVRVHKAFGNVMIFCAAGNHSRTTKKMPFKNMAYTNYDWLLYQLLSKHFDDSDDINFSIADGSDIQFKIYNHRYRMTHGGQFRGGQGFIGPYAPITRGEMKKRAAAETYGESYNTLVIGHFHQLMTLNRVIVNGSLIGYNEMAMDCNFPYEPPRQALWITHPKRGITVNMPIYCDSRDVKTEKSSWVSWAE